MTVASDLLRFILELLSDPAKADEFNGDPQGVLAVAGLSDVSCADIDAISPLIAGAVPGAVAIVNAGSATASSTDMIQNIVKNVAISNYDNSGLIQSIWSAGDVRQAFASDGGLAIDGGLVTDAPIVLGDGNIVATDTAQASGRDTIQNQGDGNLALGGDQTIAQDNGVIAGGDNIAAGDKVGGNNNKAENTGNDNSVSVGGNQNNAVNTGNDNSVSVGGNQNSAENTGNSTVHDSSTTVGGNQNNSENTGNSTVDDHSVTVGDVSLDLSDRSDNSTTVGGNQNSAENTGNSTVHDSSTTVGGNQNSAENTGNDNSTTIGDIDLSDNSDNSTTIGDIDLSDNSDNSTTIGDIAVDLSDNSDNSVGGDFWEAGSNVGGVGNTDNRNSGNTVDSGNTVVVTEIRDDSINVGTIAVDLSSTVDNSVGDVVLDNSVTTGDTVTDNSVTSGDVVTDYSVTTGDIVLDNSVTSGDTVTDNSVTSGDTVDASFTYDDHSTVTTSGDTVDTSYTYDDHSNGGDYYNSGAGNTEVVVEVNAPTTTTDYNYTWGE